MLRKLYRSFLWAMSQGSSKKGEVGKAISYVDRMEKIAPLRYYEMAYKATLLFRAGEYQSGEAMMRYAAHATAEAADDNAKYVNRFSRTIIAQIESNKMEEEAMREQARSLQCKDVLRRWLPL